MRRFFFLFFALFAHLNFGYICPLDGSHPSSPLSEVYLATPDLAQENLLGFGVGIRPYRKSGVRLEVEPLNDKYIIHNYGYGGSGLTLAFGASQEVLQLLDTLETPIKKVAVLGAGVVGLATAYDLLNAGYEVTLYAQKWSPDLTSNVAAGIWTPLLYPKDLPETTKQLHAHLLQVAYDRLIQSTGESPEFLGVRLLPWYTLKKGPSPGETVMLYFDNGTIQEGKRRFEISIEGQLFIKDLMTKVQMGGATFVQREFHSLDEIASLEEDIVVNCTSIGSRELFGDDDFLPVRGQLLYFKKQEAIDYTLFQWIEEDTNPTFFVSFYPWEDRLIVGGVYEYGQNECLPTSEVLDTLLKNAQRCLSNSSE